MSRGASGFLGGLAGGATRQVLEQFFLSAGISSMSTIGAVARALNLQNSVVNWLVYLLVAGAVGWLISLIVRRNYPRSYLSSGVLLGLIIWAAMNLLFSVTGLAIPSWSRTSGTLIADAFTHLAMGVIIAYALSRTRLAVRGENEAAAGPS